MTSRALLSVLLLLGSTGAYAKESAPGGDAGGGNTQQQCSDVDNAMEAAGVAPVAKPRVVKAPAAPVRAKPAKALPTATRGDSEVDGSRLPTPRWHSFLPGMFR